MRTYSSVITITLLALAVLSILISENDRIPTRKRNLFLAANLMIALAAVAECAGVHLSGKTNIPKGVLAAVKAVDYTLTPMTGGALIALIEEPNEKHRLLAGVFITNTVFQIVSAFRGWMVVIDAQHQYTHGRLYPVYMALYILVILVLMVKMLSYGRSFRKQNRKSLYAIILLIFTGIAMQEILGHEARVAYLAAAFGSAFLYIHYSEFAQLRLDETITEQQLQLSNDPLTGALSRFAYIDAIRDRSNCIPEHFAVFLIDINGLKRVNDSIGHEAGDELICGAAACIEASVGKGGETFRIGGDEFVVFTTLTREQAEAALSELKRQTDGWSGERIGSLSLSAGYALAAEHPELSIEALVREADKAMYEQKKEYYRVTGRDRRGAPQLTT